MDVQCFFLITVVLDTGNQAGIRKLLLLIFIFSRSLSPNGTLSQAWLISYKAPVSDSVFGVPKDSPLQSLVTSHSDMSASAPLTEIDYWTCPDSTDSLEILDLGCILH
jgi:hypothetical protein